MLFAIGIGALMGAASGATYSRIFSEQKRLQGNELNAEEGRALYLSTCFVGAFFGAVVMGGLKVVLEKCWYRYRPQEARLINHDSASYGSVELPDVNYS